MIIIGNWLDRVDTPEGRETFKKRYDIDVFEYMIESEVTHITRLFPESSNSGIAHVVIMETDNTINQIFSLQKGEHIMAYSSGCMSEEKRVFNTDGMAFFQLISDCERQSMYCLENSPYDMEERDWEDGYDDDSLTKEQALQKIAKILQEHNADYPVLETNTLFVRQL